MVVFTCNNCGDSLQKPKVAKHYQFQCRKSISLTCVDCFKDFLGDEYNAHTKCITEAERYGGKNYVAKPSSNKGERKQQEWINIVNNVVASAPNMSREEKNLLNYISKHENIPRKKPKFINFVRSAMGNRVTLNVIEGCWTKLESAFKEMAQSQKPIESKTDKKSEKNGVEANGNSNKPEEQKEKLDIENNEELSNGNEKTNLKSKKRKLKSTNSEESDEPVKKLHITDKNDESEKKTKFDWHSKILEIMGTKEEISIKKLEKKIVNKYLNEYSSDSSREKIISRFNKKLQKYSDITIVDTKVKRVS